MRRLRVVHACHLLKFSKSLQFSAFLQDYGSSFDVDLTRITAKSQPVCPETKHSCHDPVSQKPVLRNRAPEFRRRNSIGCSSRTPSAVYDSEFHTSPHLRKRIAVDGQRGVLARKAAGTGSSTADCSHVSNSQRVVRRLHQRAHRTCAQN